MLLGKWLRFYLEAIIIILTKAIIIIYSDGYIDSIDIGEASNHSKYYIQLMESSEYFKVLCNKSEIDSRYRFQFDRILIDNGAIVISNWNLYKISKDKSFIYRQLPQFIVMLPDHDITREQEISFNQLFDDYPEENFSCNRYDNISKKFNSCDIDSLKSVNVNDESNKL